MTATISSALPLVLLLLACPLMMVFMMRGHGHGHGHGGHGPGGHGPSGDATTERPTLDDLRAERDQLDQQIERLEAQDGDRMPAAR